MGKKQSCFPVTPVAVISCALFGGVVQNASRTHAVDLVLGGRAGSNKNLPIRACQSPLRGLLSGLFLGKAVRLTAAIGLSRPTIYKDLIMAVKIRMKRVGAKNAPVFRIVVADGRSPRDGKFIEQLGTYQPRKKGDNYTLNLDRAKYWLSKGAQPSDTVASFIKKSSKAATAAAAA